MSRDPGMYASVPMIARVFPCLLLLGCGAERPASLETPDAAPTDAPPDEGLSLDASSDGPEPKDEIEVAPANATIEFDLAATPPKAATRTFVAKLAGEPIDATFSIDDPALGAFSGSTFSSAVPPSVPGFGKTAIVVARAGAKRGRAKLTLVKLRASGDLKDFLFYSPQGSTPYPEKDSIRVVASATNGGAGADVKVVLKNDPANEIDARTLVRVRAMDEGWPKAPSDPCEPQPAVDTDGDGVKDTFTASPSTRALCFEVRPLTNATVPSKDGASFLRVVVEVVTSKGAVLQTRNVVVVVPANDVLR